MSCQCGCGRLLHLFDFPRTEARADTAPAVDGCGCYDCVVARGLEVLGVPEQFTRMIVCARCGNKRCPHAKNHANACTDSNDVGQVGSRFEDWPRLEDLEDSKGG